MLSGKRGFLTPKVKALLLLLKSDGSRTLSSILKQMPLFEMEVYLSVMPKNRERNDFGLLCFLLALNLLPELLLDSPVGI